MEKPGLIEVVTTHPITQSVFAAASAAGSQNHAIALIGSVFPVLANLSATAAASRRVENAINKIENDLVAMKFLLESITEDQLLFINEMIQTALQTIDDAKIDYLRNAIRNTVFDTPLGKEEGRVVARIVRDISASEALFVSQYFNYQEVGFKPPSYTQEDEASWEAANLMIMEESSKERTIVAGLSSLGLIMKGSRWMETYAFTPIAAKLLSVLKQPSN